MRRCYPLSQRGILRVIIAVTILVCGATLFANAEPAIPDAHKAPGPPAGEWQLVFDDEFSGSTLSLRKWELYDSPGEGGHGLRRPSAFSLDGRGDLVVTAAMVDGILVSGGMAARYDQAYGYYEVRVRTDPDPTGTLSGVVLTWPRSGNWPQDGENDLYETQDGGGHWPFRTFIHYGADNAKFFYTHRADSSQWHVVGMDWEPDGLTVYRDGVRVWRLTDPNAIPRVAHHVCIQLDAEGTTPLTAPVHMYVDYVRVWRLRTAARLGP